MKIRSLSLLGIVMLAACSSPKFAYKFDYHDYNAGRNAREIRKEVAADPGPVAIEPESLTAEAIVAEKPVSTVDASREAFRMDNKNTVQLSKAEKKEFRNQLKALKAGVKQLKRNPETGATANESKAIDKDLKLAAIFGAVGLVGLIIGGEIFWIIGGIALIIGVIFFVRWLLRQ